MVLKILVLGGPGMLGKAVIEAGRQREHQMVYGNYDVVYSIGLVDAQQKLRPDVVINCAGVIPSKSSDNVRTILVNAVGPHNVAKWFPDAHIIQVSTDCVYSGDTKGPLGALTARPDPNTLYGRTKLVGELTGPRHTTVRTSFIGYTHGLLPWFLSYVGPGITGWVNAIWTGSTVYEVARQLIKIAEDGPRQLVHLAAPFISKYSLLCELRIAFDKSILIIPTESPHIYRELDPTIKMPDIMDVMDELVSKKLHAVEVRP